MIRWQQCINTNPLVLTALMWLSERECLCKKHTLNICVVKEHQVSDSLSDGSGKKKMFFVLSWPLFHKLEMIQRKIKFKKFISAVAKSSDSLSCSKGCSQFCQPNLFVLMVGDRLPGVGWANSSRDQTRGWEGWDSSFSHALCEEPQRGTLRKSSEAYDLWDSGWEEEQTRILSTPR